MKKSNVIEINSDKIPYNEIKKLKDVTLIIVTEDEKVLENVLGAITKFQEDNKDINIILYIARSYEKLPDYSFGL